MLQHLLKITVHVLLAGLLNGWVTNARAERSETAVWQIGQPDGNYAELALAGRYADFNAAFTQGVHFEVGHSKPEADWPYIQPGPTDTWAGSKEHPFEIGFDLAQAPGTLYRLEIDAVDAQASYPPAVTVLVNGRELDTMAFRPGVGDASLTKPNPQSRQAVSAWIPGGWLMAGHNTLTLTTRAGSWILYDSVALRQVTGTAPVEKLSFTSTILFKGPESHLKQVVLAGMDYFGQGEVQATLTGATGWTVRQTFRDVRPGEGRRLTLEIPEVKAPEKAHLTLNVDGQAYGADGTVKPEKKWKLYVMPMSHFDLGYTGPQEECLKTHRTNADKALDAFSQEDRFAWDMEAGLAEEYLSRGTRPEEFIQRMKEGRIGVQGIYANMLTGLCSTEELSRTMDFYDRLRREHGVASTCATQTDVPSFVGTLPMLLGEHGIKYLSLAGNPYRGMLKVEHPDTPFWWQAPDGSRVLTHMTLGYGGLSAVPGAALGRIDEQGMAGWMDHYVQLKDYPYDALLMHGYFSDNLPANASVASAMTRWNEQYAYPRIIGCRGAEFFEYIEKRFAKDVITVKGDQGVFWEDGAGSSAYETAEARQAKNELVQAERLAVMSGEGANGPVRQAFADAWRNIVLYDEHTWGAAASITDPFTSLTLTQWDVKKSFADRGLRQAEALKDRMAAQYAARLPQASGHLLVFNPSAWARQGVVSVFRPEGPETIEVSNVPPLGSQVVTLPAGEAREMARTAGVTSMENDFYAVRLNPDTGAVDSLRDKQLGRELVDQSGAYRVNEYLYVTGAESSRVLRQVNPADLPEANKLKIHRCAAQRFELRRQPGVQTLVVESRAPLARACISKITLYDHQKRIDFEVALDKEANLGREAGYVAFPFAFGDPAVRIDLPGGVIRPNVDQQPGSCKDWFCAQRFVTVSDPAGAVAWTAPDSPLLTLQDIHRGQYFNDLPVKNGHIYAYLFNNYWDTNYKASQGGPLSFRFSLTSAPKITDEEAARFGEEVALPLVVCPAGPAGVGQPAAVQPVSSTPAQPTPGAGLAIQGEGIIMESLAPARFAPGVALTLRETAGRPGKVKIPVASIKPSKAYRSNLAEDKLEKLPIRDGMVEVPCRPLGLTTVLLEE